MTNSQAFTMTASSQSERQSLFTSNPGVLLFLKISQALCVGGLIFCAIETFIIPIIPTEFHRFLIYDAGFLTLLIFLFRLKGQFSNFTKDLRNDLYRKARLYSNLLPKEDIPEDTPDELIEAREKALEYSQELIEDYKRVRETSRNLYYIFQIATIILSSATPILVLLDQQANSPDIPYLKWLPVIFPAIAAVVTSISTSFPFQERWVNADNVVELLEAEQEKFILGITEPYRAFMIVDNHGERRTQLKLAIENFIVEVNKIHLKQHTLPDTKKGKQETGSDSQ